MYLRKYKKIDIAQKMLETALELYNKGEDYFSVLHLAGASEEILGRLLELKGISNSLNSEIDAFISVYKEIYRKNVSPREARNFLNKVKNAIKHMSGIGDKEVVADPKEDAETMLDRAITNWWRLEQDLTLGMEQFINRKFK